MLLQQKVHVARFLQAFMGEMRCSQRFPENIHQYGSDLFVGVNFKISPKTFFILMKKKDLRKLIGRVSYHSRGRIPFTEGNGDIFTIDRRDSTHWSQSKIETKKLI